MYQRCCSRQNIQGSLHSSLDPAKFRTKVSESTLKARLWVLCQLFRAHPHRFTGGSSDAQQQHGSKKTQNPMFLLLFSCYTSTGLVKSVIAENRETLGSALPPAAHPNRAEQQIPSAGAAAGLTHGVTGLSTACCKRGCLPPQQTATGDNIQRYHPCRAGTAGLAACKGMDCFRASGFHKFPLHTLSYAQSRIIQLL